MTTPRDDLRAALGDGYTLERELGGGGMSRVFVARDLTLGREIVVKMLSPELAASLSTERFTREIRLAAALQEPHIVPVLAAGQTADGLPWYSMPYVTGESLRARLTHGPLPVGEALGILRNVAQALAYAHERGIVHRDIKPDNVLLSSGTAVVTDFGIAKALSASTTQAPGATLTSVGTSIGTPAYMAPEQAVGDSNVDQRADLYAWGVMAYELLAEAHPFAMHTTPQALITAHLTQLPAPIAPRGGTVPATIAALVMQCLAKDPAARPASARDLLRVLDDASTPGAQPAATAPTVGSRRGLLVALAVAVALVGGSVPLWRGRLGTGAELDRSVAVLPFENAGGDSAQEYFADGLTEELIGRLAAGGLRVTGRNSVFTYKGQHPAPRTVGEVLHVGNVLTGSVRRRGDMLHVTAELASVAKDAVLWTFSVDRDARDIFALQRQLVDSVEAHFRVAPSAARPGTFEGTRSLEAHDAYLRGIYGWNQLTRDGMNAAIAQFDRAIALDSTYARAHAGKVMALAGLADGYVPPSEILEPAMKDARLALAADSTLPMAWGALATVAEYQYDWPAARRALDRSRLLGPPGDLWWYAEYIYRLHENRLDAGLAAIEAGLRTDPLSAILLVNRHYVPQLAGQTDSAWATFQRAPSWIQAVDYTDSFHARIVADLGRTAEAETLFVRAEPGLGHRSPGLGLLYARTGRRSEALKLLAQIEAAWPKAYIPPELVAEIPAALGDTLTMYTWLERGVKAHSAFAMYLGMWGKELGSHRGEPHYQAILKRVGIPSGGPVK